MTPSIHPGKSFLKIMMANDWKLSEASSLTGIEIELLRDIVLEAENVDSETAAGLEKASGMNAKYWLGLQAKHNACLAGTPLPSNVIEKVGA